MSKNILLLLLVAICLAGSTGCDTADGGESHFTVGLATNNPNGLKNVQGFRDEMAGLGYIEGENVTYMFAGEPTKGDDLDAMLESMVAAEVDLIFTAGTPTGVAAHRITEGTGIPVVFGVIADPLAAGVMEDLTTPGGNMTGVNISQNQARRLELLLEMVPGIQRIFVPFNPEDAAPVSAVAQIIELAPALGVEIMEGHARNDDEVAVLLNNIPENIDAIFMLPDSTINARLADLVAVAIERKLPVSGPSIAQVEGGALTAYGIIHHKAGAQAAHIAHQILMGADPGSLPVQTAEFYLGINLQTAATIGVDVPDDLLQSAEIIIRDETQ
jgi:putative ABC transport system substrate-binding protein